jgi:rare lipoprotein A (peptidoglycan hydrolase)
MKNLNSVDMLDYRGSVRALRICILTAGLLLAVLAPPLSAQRIEVEEGLAVRYESGETGLYATHAMYPFGTEMLVTNLENGEQVTVQVGGRPARGSKVLVELSSDAADLLAFMYGTMVRIEAQIKEPEVKAMRPRVGSVKQTGMATLLAAAAPGDLIASHPSIPIGTRVKITNTSNGRSTVITIRGRIRASRDRILEISRKAALELGMGEKVEIRLETVNN